MDISSQILASECVTSYLVAQFEINFQTVGRVPHKLSHITQMLAVHNWDFVHSSVNLSFPHLLEPILKLTPLRPV